MFLILVRHGNTFEADQKPYYVGGKTDLPLTQTGAEQAAAFADAMEKAGIMPAKVYMSELKRTQQHMTPLIARLELTNIGLDKRLNEMDYGTWERKTNAEVDAMYDGSEAPRKAWDSQGIRPTDAGFGPSEETIRKNIEDLAGEIVANFDDDKIAVVCTSNGIIRYFLQLIPNAYESAMKKGVLKVSTGSVSGINLHTDPAQRKVYFWNKKPDEAPLEDF